MFEGKAMAYPRGAPYNAPFYGQACELTCKFQSGWGRLARDKRSSLFGLFFSDEEKKFDKLTPELLKNNNKNSFKNFDQLQIFALAKHYLL